MLLLKISFLTNHFLNKLIRLAIDKTENTLFAKFYCFNRQCLLKTVILLKIEFCFCKHRCVFFHLQMVKMDNLPLDLYQSIFNYLRIDDLFNLRLVNKKLNKLLKDYKIDELFFYDASFYVSHLNYHFDWAMSKKPVLFRNLIEKSKLFILRNPFFQIFQIENLKSLKIDKYIGSFFNEFNLEDLNQFYQLVHLEISLTSIRSKYENRLSLPNLIFFYFKMKFNKLDLMIDCPSLAFLSLAFKQNDYLDNVRFEHLASIRYLRINRLINNVSIFKNIECLECKYDSDISVDDLSNFIRLKEVKFRRRKDAENSNLTKIIEYKTTLNEQFKIYHAGIEVLADAKLLPFDEKKLAEFDYYFTKLLIAERNSPNLLADNLSWIRQIQYTNLMNLIKIFCNENFNLLKFLDRLNVKEIKLDRRVEDQGYFISFIKNCLNLNSLHLLSSNLDQKFFEELPGLSSSLSYLVVIDQLNAPELNFEFVNRIYNLEHLVTSREIDLEEVELEKLIHLRTIEFFIKSHKQIRIETYKKSYLLKLISGKYDLDIKIPESEINYKECIELYLNIKKQLETKQSKFRKWTKCFRVI